MSLHRNERKERLTSEASYRKFESARMQSSLIKRRRRRSFPMFPIFFLLLASFMFAGKSAYNLNQPADKATTNERKQDKQFNTNSQRVLGANVQ